MKMKPEHFAHMKLAMTSPLIDIDAMRGVIAADRKVKDADKRLRWDMLYAAGLGRWICDNLYSYMDDTHIDTALRTIMKDMHVDA
jgi:hypothetical protein